MPGGAASEPTPRHAPLAKVGRCNETVILRFCNHACTLTRGAGRTRMSIGAVLAAVMLACLAIFGTPPAGASSRSPACPGANLSPTAANAATVAAATLCLIDQVRAGYHLGQLRSNTELRTLASSQVNDMVSWNYFADDRPGGLTPFSLVAGTRYPAHARAISVGQNIGWGTGEYATPANMVAGWMASPPHRKVILTGVFQDAGVGVTPAVPRVVERGLAGATYAIEFARRF
jgi:uncharacterized protein YkwD